MKLSETTLAILNNIKHLNNSILFYPGTEIKNLSADGTVYFTATITEEIPLKFAIFDLRNLLNVLSVIRDGDIQFTDDHLLISNGVNSAVFRYASTQVVTDVYTRKVSLLEPAFEVSLPNEQIKNLFKMASYLDAHHVKVIPGDDGKLVLFNAKGTHSHEFTVHTGVPIQGDQVTFDISVLTLLDNIDYTLAYYPNKQLVRFAGQNVDVRYHIPCARG